MPIKKSAKKRVRQNIKRKVSNLNRMRALKKALKDAQKTLASKNPDGKIISKTLALLDKAAKNRIIHPNKASRYKSKLQKLAASKKVKLGGAKIKIVPKAKKIPTKSKKIQKKKKVVKAKKK